MSNNQIKLNNMNKKRVITSMNILVFFITFCTFSFAQRPANLHSEHLAGEQKVDFGYAIAPPYRITLSRPSGSYKTLADFRRENINLSWSNYTLMDFEPNVWQAPPVSWRVQITPYAEGETTAIDEWIRMSEGVPGFIARGEKNGFAFELSGIATEIGDAIKVSVKNTSDRPITCGFTIEHKGGWSACSNPGWIEGRNSNTLMAMQYERPDRLLIVALGADEYPLPTLNRDGVGAEVVEVPLNRDAKDAAYRPGKEVMMRFNLLAGQQKEGWIIRPYKSYEADIPSVSACEWERSWDRC